MRMEVPGNIFSVAGYSQLLNSADPTIDASVCCADIIPNILPVTESYCHWFDFALTQKSKSECQLLRVRRNFFWSQYCWAKFQHISRGGKVFFTLRSFIMITSLLCIFILNVILKLSDYHFLSSARVISSYFIQRTPSKSTAHLLKPTTQFMSDNEKTHNFATANHQCWDEELNKMSWVKLYWPTSNYYPVNVHAFQIQIKCCCSFDQVGIV